MSSINVIYKSYLKKKRETEREREREMRKVQSNKNDKVIRTAMKTLYRERGFLE